MARSGCSWPSAKDIRPHESSQSIDAFYRTRHHFNWTKHETFKTTDFLGEGAFGEVYRAVGQTTGTVVAVKLLPVGVLASAESQRALLNEVRASQQIRHPNVVEILHVNEGSSSQIGPYVVMEYVSGSTLAKLLRTQAQSGAQIPLPRAIEMMIDIAQGARAINIRAAQQRTKGLIVSRWNREDYLRESWEPTEVILRPYSFVGGKLAWTSEIRGAQATEFVASLLQVRLAKWAEISQDVIDKTVGAWSIR